MDVDLSNRPIGGSSAFSSLYSRPYPTRSIDPIIPAFFIFPSSFSPLNFLPGTFQSPPSFSFFSFLPISSLYKLSEGYFPDIFFVNCTCSLVNECNLKTKNIIYNCIIDWLSLFPLNMIYAGRPIAIIGLTRSGAASIIPS